MGQMVFAGSMEAQICCLPAPAGFVGAGRTQQRHNGARWHFSPRESGPSSPRPEARQFSSSPSVPGAFELLLELTARFVGE